MTLRVVPKGLADTGAAVNALTDLLADVHSCAVPSYLIAWV